MDKWLSVDEKMPPDLFELEVLGEYNAKRGSATIHRAYCLYVNGVPAWFDYYSENPVEDTITHWQFIS